MKRPVFIRSMICALFEYTQQQRHQQIHTGVLVSVCFTVQSAPRHGELAY